MHSPITSDGISMASEGLRVVAQWPPMASNGVEGPDGLRKTNINK